MIESDKPAFPGIETFEKYDDHQGRYVEHHMPSGGLTKREYFAAMALQGFMSDRKNLMRMNKICEGDVSLVQSRIATLSVEHADALLKELASVKEGKV